MKAHQSRLQRQQGSTLTGMIIGLVIGLSIAIAVAMLITKSSTPFTNKGGKSDKADLPLTQLQDPNKPLYSNRDAAKDAAKDFVKDGNADNKAADKEANKPATADAPAVPAPAVTVAPAKPAEAKQDIKVVIDKAMADKSGDKPADAAKTDGTDDKYIYFLQAGAFKEQSDAESAKAKLALIGFEAKVTEKRSDTGTMYRVRIGPFNQVETMNRMRSKLSENSVDVAVVRTVK
ncbi:SPOR domain-containing protein [Undibacterium sp. SXout7W]|uniref:SPOR domain-containing protein n=1 Tax=Undibacterium sp. SXout7W TaxID=3413049 RepID=UPI003BF2C240